MIRGGVFSFKKKNKNVDPLDYFGNGTKVQVERYKAYRSTCHEFDLHVHTLHTSLTSDLFGDLVSYITHDGVGTKFIKLPGSRRELPTAALITGVNTPDHHQLFHQLSILLDHKQEGIGYVAILHSKDCPSLKYTLSHLVNQLMDNKNFNGDSDDENSKTVVKKSRSANMQILKSWYEHKEKGKTDKPIIIILEDIEMFNPLILQDFIAICSKYLNNGLPIILVFGIATCIESVHSLLNSSTSNLLTLQTFQLEASSLFLGSIIEQVILNEDMPFKISAKVFSLILDVFLYHDFSVNNFTKAFKLTMLYHYNACDTSFLCVKDLDVMALTDSQLKLIEQMPSFAKFLATQKDKDEITKNYTYMKSVIAEQISRLNDYHANFYCVLKYLCAFVRNLPGYPLGKQLRETYVICMESGVEGLEAYDKCIKLLRNLSRIEVVRMLKECLNMKNNEQNHDLKDVKIELEKLLYDYEHLDEKEKNEPIVMTNAAQSPSCLPKKAKMHELREALLKMADNKNKSNMSHHEMLRKNCIDYLNSIFVKYLRLPTSLPLYESMYYCDATVPNHNATGQLRRALDACLRANIQRALSEPHCYIKNLGMTKNKDLEMEKSTISDMLPDLSIVYKLHLECGKFINLYDWLQAFNMILESDGKSDKESTAKLQARFIRSVSELQFLGFIKPTTKKTDHVARLTWAS